MGCPPTVSPSHVTTAAADAYGVTVRGRHATNARRRGRNVSGTEKSLSGPRPSTLMGTGGRPLFLGGE